MKNTVGYFLIIVSFIIFIIPGCTEPPQKSFYTMNYIPDPITDRTIPHAYPYTLRIREFGIAQAYDQKQIVYRTSAFELGRYFYRLWAVNPTDMVTDLAHKHFTSSHLVSHVIRRLDEGKNPDYELDGYIESMEQYESDNVWFAHLALSIKMTSLSNNKVLYLRNFDKRKEVPVHETVNVVMQMSEILNLIMNQVVHDLDQILAKEHGVASQSGN